MPREEESDLLAVRAASVGAFRPCGWHYFEKLHGGIDLGNYGNTCRWSSP